MNQNQTTENTKKIKEFIFNKFKDDAINNDSLVQIIELCGMCLNLKSISKYAGDHKMSYNGVKKHRNIVEIFDCKLVIDNQ